MNLSDLLEYMSFTSHSFNPDSNLLTRMKENEVSQVRGKPYSSKYCAVVQHACFLVVLHKVVQSYSLLFGGVKPKWMKRQRKYSSLFWSCMVKRVIIIRVPAYCQDVTLGRRFSLVASTDWYEASGSNSTSVFRNMPSPVLPWLEKLWAELLLLFEKEHCSQAV